MEMFFFVKNLPCHLQQSPQHAVVEKQKKVAPDPHSTEYEEEIDRIHYKNQTKTCYNVNLK